jgi:glycosyltransferase involved in cell wall biosynthesis
MKYTKSADVGMILEKDTNLNYRYSLPNKLFDFIAAGIPVIASELPETGKIINEYGIGIVIGNITPVKISGALRDLKADPVKLAELKQHSIEASLKINWVTESEKIRELYTKALSLV